MVVNRHEERLGYLPISLYIVCYVHGNLAMNNPHPCMQPVGLIKMTCCSRDREQNVLRASILLDRLTYCVQGSVDGSHKSDPESAAHNHTYTIAAESMQMDLTFSKLQQKKQEGAASSAIHAPEL